MRSWERRKRTLIIVRRILTDPKTALAGVMLETSFARFMASMARFNEESVPSRPFCFCRWDWASIVEPRRSGERWSCVEAVREGPNPGRDRRPSCRDRPRANIATRARMREHFTIRYLRSTGDHLNLQETSCAAFVTLLIWLHSVSYF